MKSIKVDKKYPMESFTVDIVGILKVPVIRHACRIILDYRHVLIIIHNTTPVDFFILALNQHRHQSKRCISRIRHLPSAAAPQIRRPPSILCTTDCIGGIIILSGRIVFSMIVVPMARSFHQLLSHAVQILLGVLVNVGL